MIDLYSPRKPTYIKNLKGFLKNANQHGYSMEEAVDLYIDWTVTTTALKNIKYRAVNGKEDNEHE